MHSLSQSLAEGDKQSDQDYSLWDAKKQLINDKVFWAHFKRPIVNCHQFMKQCEEEKGDRPVRVQRVTIWVLDRGVKKNIRSWR